VVVLLPVQCYLAAFILLETTPLQLPTWALSLSIFVAIAFMVPVGIISAVSETQIGADTFRLLSIFER